MTSAFTLLLLTLVAGSLVFCLLAIEGARRYQMKQPPELRQAVPISVLKPLAGVDEGLEENLRSFFEQDYPHFEILMAVATEDDAALPVARKLAEQYRHVPSRILIAGEPPYPNRKVRSVHVMVEAASHDLLVMSDSDIRVTGNMLRVVAAEFQDPKLALMTCPYRAVPGNSFWSRMEAVMMNTEFLGGILTARLVEGMRFAVGPTMVCRRKAVDVIGGFETLKNFLAEDFVFGQRVSEAAMGVGLSSFVVEHRIGTSNFATNAEHRLRWVRSTRRSRPAGYLGQVFTYPIPLGLLLCAVSKEYWPVLAIGVMLRMGNAWQTAVSILNDPLVRNRFWLVPLQDSISFLFYLAGFVGNTIQWRGKAFFLKKDGTFTRIR